MLTPIATQANGCKTKGPKAKPVTANPADDDDDDNGQDEDEPPRKSFRGFSKPKADSKVRLDSDFEDSNCESDHDDWDVDEEPEDDLVADVRSQARRLLTTRRFLVPGVCRSLLRPQVDVPLKGWSGIVVDTKHKTQEQLRTQKHHHYLEHIILSACEAFGNGSIGLFGVVCNVATSPEH